MLFRFTFFMISCCLVAAATLGCADEPEADDEPVVKDAVSVEEDGRFDITDIRINTDYQFEPFNIRLPEGDGPRLLCGAKTLAKFSQPRDSLRFRTLMNLAREYWEAYEAGDPPDDPSAAAYMALAAHLSGNESYTIIAANLILENLSVPSVMSDTLDNGFWAAIGYDFIRQKLNQPERDVIEEAARARIDKYLLPRALDAMRTYPDFEREYYYQEALLWELALTGDESRLEELIINARPYLQDYWSRLEGQTRGLLWFNDPQWFAVQTCEFIGRVDIIAKEHLDDELQITFIKLRSDESKVTDLVDDVMNLARWEHRLEGDDLTDYEKWIEEVGYSPEALIHIAVKMDMRG